MALRCSWLVALALVACQGAPDVERAYQVGYRDGTAEDDYMSSGERGSVTFTEINWAGSVRGASLDEAEHDPDDIFVELQSKMARPIHLTGWYLVVRTDGGRGYLTNAEDDGRNYVKTYRIPPRETSEPIYTNDYVVIARKRDGAFADADFFIEDLELPTSNIVLTLQDADLRLIDGVGSFNERVFAGGWDLATVRSLERVQLIFANSGNRDASWHAYSLNTGEPMHEALRANIGADFSSFTFGTPGMPNSPDYSGNISSGVIE